MDKPIITIVQAVKEWTAIEIQRFALSISSQPFAKKIQLVVVFSGISTEAVMMGFDINIGDIKFIHTHPEGVYSAFNIGINHADGKYIIFSGGDDFFMPGLSDVMSNFLLAPIIQADVIAATVCFGDSRLLNPSKSKIGMIMGNWCQQGILYRRDIFDRYQFDTSYKIQADHKLNIEIIGSSDTIINYSDTIVSYFSCKGISQSRPDLDFWRDMPYIVHKNFGLIYAIICYLRRLVGLLFYGDPKKRFK